jgi:hypothetical protein
MLFYIFRLALTSKFNFSAKLEPNYAVSPLALTTEGAMTFSIMTFSIMTLSIMTFGIGIRSLNF